MGLNKMENEKKVMGRMEWFRDIMRIFNKLGVSIPKKELLEAFKKEKSEFELEDPRKVKGMAFSYKEVYNSLVFISQEEIQYEHITDSLIKLSLLKKRSQPLSDLKLYYLDTVEKPVKKKLTLEMNLRELCGLLDESPDVEEFSSNNEPIEMRPLQIRERRPEDRPASSLFNRLEEQSELKAKQKIEENYEILSLAGCFSTFSREIPTNLIVLNLSYNNITQLNLPELPFLKFLNISHNRISSFKSTFRSLEELFAQYNLIPNLYKIPSTILLLDLSNNKISSLESIAVLTFFGRLKAINLRGNPLFKRFDFQESIDNLIPRTCKHETDIIAFSSFRLTEVAFEKSLKNRPMLTNREAAVEDRITPVRSASTNTVKIQPEEFKTKEIPRFFSSNSKPPIRKPLIVTSKNSPRSYRCSRISLSDFSPIPFNSSEYNFPYKPDKPINISDNTIEEAASRSYHNPVAAMMIGPPPS